MDILRIAALGTAGVLLGITVKGAKPEFALLVTDHVWGAVFRRDL